MLLLEVFLVCHPNDHQGMPERAEPLRNDTSYGLIVWRRDDKVSVALDKVVGLGL